MSSKNVLVLETILRNPKLKRKFEEAYNAPIGSTKRQSMMDTVFSIKKIGDRKFNNRQDGQGGPSGVSSNLEDRYSGYATLATSPYNQSTSVSIPKAAPANALSAPKTQFQNDVSGATNAVGEAVSGLPSLYSKGSKVFDTMYNTAKLGAGALLAADEYIPRAINNYFTKPAGYNTTLAKDTMGGRMISDVNNFYPVDGEATPSKNSAAKNVASQVLGVTNGTIVKDPSGKLYAKDPSGNLTYIKDQKTLVDYVKNKKFSDISGTDAGKIPPVNVEAWNAAVKGSGTSSPMTMKNVAAGAMAGVAPYKGGASDTGSSMSSGSESSGPAAPELYGDTMAINSGPLATYMKAMSSEANRRSYFPGQSEDFYKNGSGNLHAMIGDLKNSLKVEYGIDDLEAKYNDALLSQQNIVPDLKDYITRRDTAIKDLDGLIAKAEHENAYSTTSDPAFRGAQNDYVKNLYTLRSRQSTRYMSMLDRAQQVADKNLTRITNDLNTKIADFNDRLATETAITTDQYNNMKDLITESWTQANNLDANRVAKKELAAKEAALDLSALNGASGSGTGAGDGTGLLGIPEYKSYRDINLDTNENLKPGRDASTILAEYNTVKDKDGNTISAQYPVQTIKTGFQNGLSVKTKDANGDMIPDDQKSMENLKDYINQFNATKAKLKELSPAPGSGEGVFAEQIGDVLLGGAQKLIDKYVPGNIETIKSATKSLKNISKDNAGEIAKWRKANSNIPSAVLDGLEQAWMNFRGNDFDDYFGLKNTGSWISPSDTFDQKITDIINYGVKTLIGTYTVAQ